MDSKNPARAKRLREISAVRVIQKQLQKICREGDTETASEGDTETASEGDAETASKDCREGDAETAPKDSRAAINLTLVCLMSPSDIEPLLHYACLYGCNIMQMGNTSSHMCIVHPDKSSSMRSFDIINIVINHVKYYLSIRVLM